MWQYAIFQCVLIFMLRLAVSQRLASGLSAIRAPTKGSMLGLLGDNWTLHIDSTRAERLDFLPEASNLSERKQAELKDAVVQSFNHERESARWRRSVLRGSYYFSGKGLQKVGTLCLLLEQFFSLDDWRTQECTGWMAAGFRCFYDAAAASTNECNGASQSYYDEDWGGIASRQGWDRAECASDFGNTCYNDHHYHFGYFVVSGAILVKLNPSYVRNQPFVDYVNTLIRDTANPSSQDKHFPRFRSFDWFDMHSWSHGIQPVRDGKDQESTSEELNLFYGMVLWGRVNKNAALQKLGATMLSLAAHSARELFLMKSGNSYHPEDFVKNHVTGIFFQGRVDHTTWFGMKPEYIHGIQMLPLSPALTMARKADFCRQEWDDILSHVDLGSISKAWASIILTGSLAMVDPSRAYELLHQYKDEQMDDGLSRAWALYWTATRPGEHHEANAAPAAAVDNPFAQVGLEGPPPPQVFPSKKGHPVKRPENVQTKGPWSTNKFWANWLVKDGFAYPIYTMPYVLTLEGPPHACKLHISHGTQRAVYGNLGNNRMQTYFTPHIPDLSLGTKEPTTTPRIVNESLFGTHVSVRGLSGEELSFPIFTGMPYITGQYSGFTPRVSHPHGLEHMEKIKPGVWSLRNRRQQEYRVYVLQQNGHFVDNSYDFDNDGLLNRKLHGWVRVAHLLKDGDCDTLDRHASALLVGCDVDITEHGSVRYIFQRADASDVELLHLSFGHQMQLMLLQTVEAPASTPASASSNASLEESQRSQGPLLL